VRSTSAISAAARASSRPISLPASSAFSTITLSVCQRYVFLLSLAQLAIHPLLLRHKQIAQTDDDGEESRDRKVERIASIDVVLQRQRRDLDQHGADHHGGGVHAERKQRGHIDEEARSAHIRRNADDTQNEDRRDQRQPHVAPFVLDISDIERQENRKKRQLLHPIPRVHSRDRLDEEEDRISQPHIGASVVLLVDMRPPI
jgi:hypothetical protein